MTSAILAGAGRAPKYAGVLLVPGTAAPRAAAGARRRGCSLTSLAGGQMFFLAFFPAALMRLQWRAARALARLEGARWRLRDATMLYGFCF